MTGRKRATRKQEPAPGVVTVEDLERLHQATVQQRRAQLRERYAYLNGAILEAEAAGDAAAAHELTVLRGFVVRDAGILDRDEAVRTLKPKALVGEKFTQGRKPGSASPLRLAVRRIVKRNPKAKAAEVWAALKAKPPRGIVFHDEWGGDRYVKTEGHGRTEYRRFLNIVSEERNALTPK